MTKGMIIVLILSVILAVGAPLLNALHMTQQYKTYPSFRVVIEPYDPRDLFYGHYLTFRTAWNWKDAPLAQERQGRRGPYQKNSCLCVEEGNENPPVYKVTCPAAGAVLPQCRHILKGESYGEQSFEARVNRYYLDEAAAMPLERQFRDGKKKFTLDLYVTPGGKALPGQLYVEDVPLEDYIKRNGGRVPDVDRQDNP